MVHDERDESDEHTSATVASGARRKLPDNDATMDTVAVERVDRTEETQAVGRRKDTDELVEEERLDQKREALKKEHQKLEKENKYEASLAAMPEIDTAEVLHMAEVERSRIFSWTTQLFCMVIYVVVYLIDADPDAAVAVVLSTLAFQIFGIVLLLRLRDPNRFSLRWQLIYYYFGVVTIGSVIVYMGVYSGAVAVFVYALCYFGTSESFNASLSIYILATITSTIAVALRIFGTLDVAAVIPFGHLTVAQQFTLFAMGQVALLLAFSIGRASRRATLSALDSHSQVVRELAYREDLLREAKADLELLLRAGDIGRYTERRLGDYRLGCVIGRGAVGEVYEAQNIDSGESAAIKVLHQRNIRNSEHVEGLVREAELTASVDSPYICQVHAIGGADEEVPYIAMELLEGRDLSEILRETTQMPIAEVLIMVRMIASGLDAAKESDIVHRDINPHNLFCVTAGEEPVWKILDFGVSKVVEPSGDVDGETVGTPAYMAPEQAGGRVVDYRCDLFALAAVAYRSLTGFPPFAGDAVPQILFQVMHEPPKRPGSLTSLEPEVDLVLAIGLAKDRRDRFQSGDEFASALEAAARGQLASKWHRRAEELLSKQAWKDN
jgi:serine/threonine-protein kinase